jgi:hypothetical protein
MKRPVYNCLLLVSLLTFYYLCQEHTAMKTWVSQMAEKFLIS